MEKKCNCDCHKLQPAPCTYCAARHVEAEPGAAELFENVHDEQTEPGASASSKSEGFPF